MSSVGPNQAACFGPRTKLSKAYNSPPDQNRLPETVLGPFQDRTKSAVTARSLLSPIRSRSSDVVVVHNVPPDVLH